MNIQPLKTLFYIVYRLCRALCILSLVAVFAFQLQASQAPSLLERIQDEGKIVIASRNGSTTFYEQEGSLSGFEYELASEFAHFLGVKLEIKEIDDLNRLIKATKNRDVHIAAAGLTVTEKRSKHVAFSKSYLNVTQELVYHANSSKPKSIKDLIGKQIVVIANSSHAENLRVLKKTYPDLSWEERYDVEMIDLLEQVQKKQVDYAVVDSNALELNAGLYPKAKAAFALSEAQGLAWALTQSGDQSLINVANQFFTEISENGRLQEIKDSFYGHLGHIEYSGALVFTKRMRNRLPKWRPALEEAAKNNDLDWKLLAAVSYQESHWNPKAKSPTGVRGFMMLTLATAKEMKIKNRLNAQQSITGGSQYYKKLYDRLPSHILGNDRIWLSLAAYNVGYGHVDDARRLAMQHGDSPDKWTDVKKYLPLLAKRQHHKHTRHGYARGWEAVSYVENIRNFYNILAVHESQNQEVSQLALSKEENTHIVFDSHVSNAVEELMQMKSL